MNIARVSVSRPVAVTMRILAFVIVGAVCFFKLQVALLPNVTFPVVAVFTTWTNVAPEEVETTVTRPIEEAVSKAENVYTVRSSSEEGQSGVFVQLNWGASVDAAAVDILQLVERARRQFPNDPTLGTPIVFKFDPSQLPIMIMGIQGPGNQIKLWQLANNIFVPRLEAATGVASAILTGGEQREILVRVHPDRLQAYGLSLDQISQRLREENQNIPSGIGREGNTEFTIRVLGLFQTPEEAGNIVVATYGGQPVYLKDVADVLNTHAEERITTRINGKPGLGVVISKTNDANTIATTDNVMQAVHQLQKEYPQVKWAVTYDQAGFIRDSIADVERDAFIGALLAVFILLFFLRDLRSTLVVATSIPISMISSFFLFYLFHMTLNVMTLSGIAMAVGLVVDDAVVVLENIFRHMERDGMSSWDAAVAGTNEITSAVIASTVTIMVVFLPLLLVSGMAGQMFTPLALSVIFAIGISLLDALTVIPMLASRFLKLREPGPRRGLLDRFFGWSEGIFERVDSSYHSLLRWALHHRWAVMGIAGGVLFASFLLVPMIGTELMPQTDSGDYNLSIKLPVGTALAVTSRVMQGVDRFLNKDKNVAAYFSVTGSNVNNFSGVGTNPVTYLGGAQVKLKPMRGLFASSGRTVSTQDDMNRVRGYLAKIPGARAFVSQFDLVSILITGSLQGVEVDVFGDDLNKLSQIGQQMMGQFQAIPGVANLDVNWDAATPEMQVVVDRTRAMELGVNFQDVANAVNAGTAGDISSYYFENGYQYPILVQLPTRDRKTVQDLLNIPLKSTTGQPVLVGQVAHVELRKGPNLITRLNRQRYIAITANAYGRSSGDVAADMGKILAHYHLPAGYHWDWGLAQKQQATQFRDLLVSLLLAIFLIYVVLATQYESLVHPLVILLAVPLASVGVILGLFLGGRAFGVTAFIGLLMLVGIVVKNAILLVDYTNQLRARGMGREEALLRAAPTRLRPILMTSSAAIFGMLPLALGLGKGTETQAPMATAVVGGLTTSTLLTLVVIPVMYEVLDDLFFHGKPPRPVGHGLEPEQERERVPA